MGSYFQRKLSAMSTNNNNSETSKGLQSEIESQPKQQEQKTHTNADNGTYNNKNNNTKILKRLKSRFVTGTPTIKNDSNTESNTNCTPLTTTVENTSNVEITISYPSLQEDVYSNDSKDSEPQFVYVKRTPTNSSNSSALAAKTAAILSVDI